MNPETVLKGDGNNKSDGTNKKAIKFGLNR